MGDPVKEFLQGRRLGFALRSHLAFVAVGIGVCVTLLDLLSWFALGPRDTVGITAAAMWLAFAAVAASAAAAVTTAAEYVDVPAEERGLARLDAVAALGAVLLYALSGTLRTFEPGAAAPSTAPFLLAIAALVLVLIDAGMAANLYSAREWEEIEDEMVRERHPRRRAAGR